MTDPIPDASSCPLRIDTTFATIRDPETGGWVEISWDERNQTASTHMFGLLFSALYQPDRLKVLKGMPRVAATHPDPCPLCALRAMSGPHLYGRWLTDSWRGLPAWAGDRHDPALIEDVGPLDHARSAAQEFLDIVNRKTRPGGPIPTATILDLHATPDPAFERRLVGPTSQLWLWETPSAAQRDWWPDRALVFRDGDLVEMDRAAFLAHAQAAQPPASPPPDDPDVILLDGLTIRVFAYTDTLAETRIVSVRDPESTRPARRIMADGTVAALAGTPRGLTVYGTHRGDRPALIELGRLTPEYGYLVQGIADDRGLRLPRHLLGSAGETGQPVNLPADPPHA